MNDLPLITKYRPVNFSEVVGHADIVAALARAIKGDSRPHAYLFTGGTGVGKTTLARIVARKLKAEVIEIDAASYSGIDDMRELVNLGNHAAMSGAGRRMFVIDECHAMSKPAWQALLKMIEEPPSHLFIALATTELAKVPTTIVGRCYHVALRNLKDVEVEDLVLRVIEAEAWKVDDDVITAVVQAANGSARNSLSILDAVRDCVDREEVNRIIRLQTASDEVINLCRYLLSGKRSWLGVQKMLLTMDDTMIEEMSIPIGRYMATVMKRAKTDQEAENAWKIINALTFPTDTFDPRGKIYAQLGRVIWG